MRTLIMFCVLAFCGPASAQQPNHLYWRPYATPVRTLLFGRRIYAPVQVTPRPYTALVPVRPVWPMYGIPVMPVAPAPQPSVVPVPPKGTGT